MLKQTNDVVERKIIEKLHAEVTAKLEADEYEDADFVYDRCKDDVDLRNVISKYSSDFMDYFLTMITPDSGWDPNDVFYILGVQNFIDRLSQASSSQ